MNENLYLLFVLSLNNIIYKVKINCEKEQKSSRVTVCLVRVCVANVEIWAGSTQTASRCCRPQLLPTLWSRTTG